MSNDATDTTDWGDLPGRLIVVSGASGSGKSTLLRHALGREDVHARLSTSATTRSPRPGEVHGREYFFVARDEFQAEIERGGLLEWAEVHGNLYGTPVGPVRDELRAGRCVVLEIDVQGALQIRKRIPAARLIFINPPSFEILEARLRARSTEDEAGVNRRLSNARREMDQVHLYDHTIVNDDLDSAVKALVDLFVRIGCAGAESDAGRT